MITQNCLKEFRHFCFITSYLSIYIIYIQFNSAKKLFFFFVPLTNTGCVS